MMTVVIDTYDIAPLSISISPLLLDHEKVLCTLDVMTPETPELAKRLTAVIDTAIDAIVTINDKAIIEMVNPATIKLFGYRKEDMLGQNIKMLMPQPYKGKHDHYVQRYNETKKAHIIGTGREVHGIKSDGTIFPMRLAVSEVILNDRVIYTGIIHDMSDVHEARAKVEELNKNLEKKIDERTYDLEKTVNRLIYSNKALEEQIIQRRQALAKLEESQTELEAALAKEQELNELKSRFVSMASHEFRTPLTSIASSASLIARYDQGDHQDQRLRHIGKIKKAVTNLTGILNDFLSLSKLEEGKISVKLSDVDIKEIGSEVAEGVRGILKGDQQVLFDLDGQLPNASSDEQLLRNILFNLVSNAIKYSDQSIECRIKYVDYHLFIDVVDHGIGIPHDDQKYLFTRFFRASNVTNIQGTGLGLNIVQRYVALLGGEISFDSIPEKGTTFHVVIPWTKPA